MLKLEYYVPKSHVQSTTQALFAAGAGQIGDYSECCWITEGVGQFRPASAANPFIGQLGELTHEPEMKVELILRRSLKADVIATLKRSHPYETPAYQLIAFEY
ncbi:MAG: NGG1p interacting factor NIF3 [Motiliproteus sp.]